MTDTALKMGDDKLNVKLLTNSKGWERYFDDENQAYYLFNPLTHESKWDITEEKSSERIFESDEVDEEVSIDEEDHLDKQRDVTKLSRDKRMRLVMKFDFVVLFLNTMFIENPICIIEGLLRCCFLLFLAVSYLIRDCLCNNTIQSNADINCLVIMEDVLFCFAAVISLLIPGMIFFIYANYDTVDDWELAPIPTLIGVSDMRRFWIISFGNAELASNIDGKSRESDENVDGSTGEKQDALYLCCSKLLRFTPSRKRLLFPRQLYRNYLDFLRALD